MTLVNRFARRWWLVSAVTLLSAGTAACTTTALSNMTAATSDFAQGLGIPTPRTIQVGFINNTPFRAIFTFGAYDLYDQESVPFSFSHLRLEGNTTGAQIPMACMQAFSVGGDDLVRSIQEHEADPNVNVTDPQALIRGVNFSGAPPNDPLAAEPTEGTAQGIVVRSGTDFTCARTDIRETTGTGLLLFTFEQDAAAPGGFRIDYTFITP